MLEKKFNSIQFSNGDLVMREQSTRGVGGSCILKTRQHSMCLSFPPAHGWSLFLRIFITVHVPDEVNTQSKLIYVRNWSHLNRFSLDITYLQCGISNPLGPPLEGFYACRVWGKRKNQSFSILIRSGQTYKNFICGRMESDSELISWVLSSSNATTNKASKACGLICGWWWYEKIPSLPLMRRL